MLTSTSTLIIDVFPLNHPEVDLAVVDSPVQLGHPPHHTDRSIFKKNLSLVKIVLDPASFYCVPPIFHSNQRREVLYFSYFRPNIISLRTQQSSAGHTVQHTGLSAGLGGDCLLTCVCSGHCELQAVLVPLISPAPAMYNH